MCLESNRSRARSKRSLIHSPWASRRGVRRIVSTKKGGQLFQSRANGSARLFCQMEAGSLPIVRESSSALGRPAEPIPLAEESSASAPPQSPRRKDEMLSPLGEPLPSSPHRSNSVDKLLAHNLTAIAPSPVKMVRGSPHKGTSNDAAHHNHAHAHHDHEHEHDHNSTRADQGPSEKTVTDLFAIFQRCCKEHNVKPWPPLVSLFQRSSVEGTNITLYVL